MVKTYTDSRDEVLSNPATHFYLKDAIRAFDAKDPVDAYNDAKILLTLQERRIDKQKRKRTKPWYGS